MLANAIATGSKFGAMTLNRSSHYGFCETQHENLSFDFAILLYGIPGIYSTVTGGCGG